MPSQITPGFGQSDCVDVHEELDVMILYAGIFFGVLRGRNSAPFPMGFRWLFSQFEKKNLNLKKKKKIFFFFFF